MSDIKKLTEVSLEFRDKREWKQFHTPKDLAISLQQEASEVLEHFLWRNNGELEKYLVTNKGDIGEELADVLFNVLLLSHELGIDLVETFYEKMKKNEQRYPVDKYKGNHKKHTKV